MPRRPLLIATNLVLAAVLLSLLTVHSPARTWLIFAVALAYGISYVLLDAGESALLPAALPANGLGDVNGWRSSAQEGMKLVAPLAGAGLYAWHGGPAVAVLSAAMPVVVAVLYAALRLTAPPATGPGARPGRSLRAGLAALAGERVLRVTVWLAALSIAVSGFATAAQYEVVTGELGLAATFLGVLLSAQGAGSIAGGLVVGRLLAGPGGPAVGVIGTALFAAGLVARCLPWWPALVAGAVIGGVGLPWTLVAAVTAVQTRTPPELLGRVAATANTVMFAPTALAIPLGAAAVHVGARPTLLAGAAVCLGAAGVAVRSSRRGEPSVASVHIGG
ncbi:MFS transporter [Amorphoplanes nipponensis]